MLNITELRSLQFQITFVTRPYSEVKHVFKYFTLDKNVYSNQITDFLCIDFIFQRAITSQIQQNWRKLT